MKKEQIKAIDRIKESQDEIRSYMTLCEEEIKKACYQEEKASSLILKAAIQRIISLSISAINHSNELLTSILSLFDKYCLHIINLNNEYVETLKKDRKTIEGLKDDDAIKGVAFAQRLSHRMTENMIENATCSYDNMILSYYLLCLFALQCLYLSLRYYEQEKNKKFFKVLKDLGSELIDSIAIVSFLRKPKTTYMKKFLTFILVAIMMLAVIVAASEDADGKLVPKVTFPALAVATLCGLGLNRLVREEK